MSEQQLVKSIYTATNVTSLGEFAATDTFPVANLPIVTPAKGGTGVANNAASTISIVGNFPLALNLAGATTITLPTSGTLCATTGNGGGAFAVGALTATTAALSSNLTLENNKYLNMKTLAGGAFTVIHVSTGDIVKIGDTTSGGVLSLSGGKVQIGTDGVISTGAKLEVAGSISSTVGATVFTTASSSQANAVLQGTNATYVADAIGSNYSGFALKKAGAFLGSFSTDGSTFVGIADGNSRGVQINISNGLTSCTNGLAVTGTLSATSTLNVNSGNTGSSNLGGLLIVTPNISYAVGVRVACQAGASKSGLIQCNGTNASSAGVTWYAGANAVSSDGSYDIFESTNTYGISIKPTGGIKFTALLPTYADNTAAAALATGTLYRTSTGTVMIKY